MVVTEGGEAYLFSTSSLPWLAVRTRSNCEFLVEKYLLARGITAWAPAYEQRRRWSDRVKLILVPLLPGYVLCRSDPSRMLPVREAPGVVHVVGFDGRAATLPDAEVNSLFRLVNSGLPASPCPYLREGARIRIRNGPLEGAEGILIRIKNRYRLVVSLDLIQRSVSAEVDAETVEAVA